MQLAANHSLPSTPIDEFHSSPLIAACERAERPPEERLTDDCKTWVDSLNAGPTDRQASMAWRRLGSAHFRASFIAAAIHVYCCL